MSLSVFYSSIGFYGMLKDCKVIKSVSTTTRDALEQYLTGMPDGQLDNRYKAPQGRIMVMDD